MPTVLVFGGSILAPANPDPDHLAMVAARLAAWARDGPLFVVVGGGVIARTAIDLARKAYPEQTDETALDRVGIHATRVNASVVVCYLRAAGADCAPTVPPTTAEAARLGGTHGVVVMGGTEPGHSTDQVGADLARVVGASRLIIATNVNGVYSADPRTDPHAHRIDELTYDELKVIIGGTGWSQAGQKGVVDGPAVELLSGAGIETRVVNGHDLDNLEKALRGEDFHGSTIREGV